MTLDAQGGVDGVYGGDHKAGRGDDDDGYGRAKVGGVSLFKIESLIR